MKKDNGYDCGPAPNSERLFNGGKSMKRGLIPFILIASLSLVVCKSAAQKDTSLLIKSYHPDPRMNVSPENFAKNSSDELFLHEAKLLQLPMERAATLMADCLLTIDFINAGINAGSNRASFPPMFASLSDLLREYGDAGLNANLDAIDRLLSKSPFDQNKIRKIFEEDILNGFFKKHTGAIKCADCYTYDDLLGHIAFWYYLLSHDYFGEDVRDNKITCCKPIIELRREFAQKIARELLNKFDYIKDFKALQDYQFKYNVYRILDRGKNSAAELNKDGSKMQVSQPFIPGKVDMIYELDYNSPSLPGNDFNAPDAGITIRFRWK